MSARPYLLFALLFTACGEDSNSPQASGSGGTATTAGGGNGTLTSGGAGGGGTTAGGGSTSSATTGSGSAGEGQGGTAGAGAGAGGASGADGGGAGGEGGAAGECVPALHAVVRATFGDFDCPELEGCIVESCPNELAAAMGDGWASGDHSEGICADYADCVEACDCESACSLECRNEHAAGACIDAIIEISLCRNDACPAATDSCAP